MNRTIPGLRQNYYALSLRLATVSFATSSICRDESRGWRGSVLAGTLVGVTHRYIFHLSIPVSELLASKQFYVEVLGATVGRENEEWLDVLLWGHQITLQRRPEEVLPPGNQGKRHFGVVLPWTEWQREMTRMESAGVRFLDRPALEMAGTENEHAKAYLSDPSGNVIEIKAYRNVQKTLGLAE